MNFYQKYYPSCYEELLTYYPLFYRDVYEMNEILKVYGKLLDGLENTIEQTFLNNFILTADNETIKIWEDILHISYKEKLSLDQRKRVIIGRLCGGGHIGEPEIKSIISNYTENPAAVDFADGIIKIVIDGEVFDEYNLLNTLLRKIPSHLPLKITVHITRTHRRNLPIGFVGCTKSANKCPPANADLRHFHSEHKSGGGMYCFTHTTSKLIE